MIETICGIFTAVVIIILSQMLSNYFTAKLFATTILVAIAFIYTGFSLKGNATGSVILEIGFSLILYFLVLIGYTRNSLLVAYGIIFHGIWDIFHHKGWVVQTDVPGYWPSFCFVVDIIDGLFFLFLFKRQKRHQSALPVQP